MKTAIIMSKEEAMALPLKDRPICFRVSSEIYHDTFEAIGEATMCWKPRPSNETFSSEEAADVCVRLLFKFADELEKAKLDAAKSAMRLAIERLEYKLQAAVSWKTKTACAEAALDELKAAADNLTLEQLNKT